MLQQTGNADCNCRGPATTAIVSIMRRESGIVRSLTQPANRVGNLRDWAGVSLGCSRFESFRLRMCRLSEYIRLGAGSR